MKISNFAKRLKEAMEIRRVSQTELHEKTGIGKPSISAYLKGEYKAKQDKVDLIAEVLDIDPTWLIGYDVPMERSSRESFNVGYLKLTDKEETIIKKYRFIPESGKETVDAVLEIQYREAKKHSLLKELPAQFDIAASGLDENTEAGKDNMDIALKQFKALQERQK